MENKTMREIELIRENAMLEAKIRRYEQLLKIIGGECQQFLTDIEPKQTEQMQSEEDELRVCTKCVWATDGGRVCGCNHSKIADKFDTCMYYEDKNKSKSIKTEPAEPPTAHWIICSDGYYPYCSNCKTEPKSGIMSKFCPECGRKMEDGK